MPTITAISIQQKNKDRVSIFVDGKYSFSLHINQLVEQKLAENQELTKQELEKLKELSGFGKLLEQSINWAFSRPHSFSELDQYLYKKRIDEPTKQKITNYLQEKDYINDQKFAEFWAQSRIRSKFPSRKLLVAELKQKGIDQSTINSTLTKLEFNEEEMITKQLEKVKGKTKFKDSEKLKQYLFRKGFNYSLINEAIDKSANVC